MPGGEIQLAHYGAQDIYLTSNPKISYFKTVYHRYTNFATELIEVSPYIANKDIQLTSESEVEFQLSRNGDLVKDILFTFTLPAIYSNHSTTSGRNFRWIERIGEMIIKEVTFNIGGRQIDKHYGEWLHIWSELTLLAEHREGYNKMIGNVVEVYNPESIEYISGYPTSTATIPSIKSRKIYVPLKFFFNETYSNALPLIALQYDSAPTIKIKLRSLEELYTIVDTDRKRPLTSVANHNIGYYLSHESSTAVTSYDMNTNLEVEYIFIDKDERTRFALADHRYLSSQLQYRTDVISNQSGDFNYTFDLDLHGLTTNLIWVIRRTDHEDANMWSNYTNWPTSLDPLRTYSGSVDSNPFGSHSLSSQDELSYLEKNIMLNARLELGSEAQSRFATKSWQLFNLIDSYQHCTRIPTDCIYSYSFALKNDNVRQPSGSINLSTVSKIYLRLVLNKNCSQDITGSTTPYNYRIMLFSRGLNNFRIMGGLGDMEFSN